VAWYLIARYAGLTALTDQVLLALLISWIGVMATKLALIGESNDDPQWIVIDEWAGIFIALIGTSPTRLLHILIGFALFRLFDIVKPGPVRWAENLPGALGIMADDIVAGIAALGCMGVVRWF
jgi:phosphatidylglycerophosphatase A